MEGRDRRRGHGQRGRGYHLDVVRLPARARVSCGQDVEIYEDNNVNTSVGLRLEYWKQSLAFVAEAPVLATEQVAF